ncbi:MAG: zinc-ribbon domain-containing protein [Desulfobulbaceae bacterium]|nr:zinc-ribbon domain-containing protein [Desulfobulbaceae bacterium]
MIITCEKCKTRYKISDDVVKKPAIKVRCHNCNHRFMVYKPDSMDTVILLEDEVQADFNKIIAVSNQKGGVGKTSTCLNLGAALAGMGKKVLLVDFDVQANLTILLGLRKTISFYEILESKNKDISGFIETTKYPNLSLLPSNSKMALLKKKYLNVHNFEYLLKERLERIKDNYDHILIDTPPSIEFFTLNALMASNFVVIPTLCDYLSLHGINQINDIISVLKKGINSDIDFKVLITRFNAQSTSEKVIFRKIQNKYQSTMFRTVIEQDDKMQESHILNVPVIHYAENSKSAKQYTNLAKEVTG